MIRAKYVHEFDQFDGVSRAIMESESITDQLINEYDMRCEQIRIMNLSEDVDDPYFTEGVTKVIEGVGKAVETVIDKVIELIDKVVSTFNEWIWNKKSDIEKMNVLFKKYPEYAERIQIAFDRGDFDVKDIKSIQDVMNGSYDLLDKLNKGKINPSDAESKFQSLINKFNKYGKPLIEIAAGVTTVITAAKAISSLYPTLAKNKLDASQAKKTLREMKLAARIQKREERRADGKHGNTEIVRVKNRIVNGCANIVNKHLAGQNRIFGKFGSWLTRTLRSFTISDKNDKAEMRRLGMERRAENNIKKREDMDIYRQQQKMRNSIAQAYKNRDN